MRRFYFIFFSFLYLHFAHGADDKFVKQKENTANDEQHKFVNTNLLTIKDSIHAFSSVLSQEDEKENKVLYFEFTSFDNIKCFDLFRYILKDKNVIRFCPTKSAFAIVVLPEFKLEQFKLFAKSNTFDLIQIERNQYNNSLEYK